MENLIENLKHQIIEQLNLTDVDPDTISADAPLFGEEGLGLDSIDALELVVLLDKQYGIKVANPEAVKAAFANLRTLAEYITECTSGEGAISQAS